MTYGNLLLVFALLCGAAGPFGTAHASGDWPEFRGPTSQGLGDNARPPLTWGTSEHVTWKRAIPGTGWSSPVVMDDRIYLTTAIEHDDTLESLRALQLDAESGEILWNVPVFDQLPRIPKHPKNGYASPTPIVSGERLFVHFGPLGTACLNLDGAVLWRQSGLAYKTPHGNGGSPALAGDRLIISYDDNDAPFIAALDTQTGKVLWKTFRNSTAGKKFSFSTPLIMEEQGRHVAVSTASGLVGAYDLRDGNLVWQVRYGEGFSIVPRPVLAHGLIFLGTGFARPSSIYAIRTGGAGDVTDSHVAWTSEEGTPHTPSMLVVGAELYCVSDRGEISCRDAVTGKIHWIEKVDGKFSASPVFADGRIYATSEGGKTTVFAAGKRFQVLATNDLAERIFASPALSGKALYLRTEHQLYRLEE